MLAIGPIPMMQAVAEVTRPHKIPTTVSLNPIMVDGTGMCGGCRVLVGGESRFACVDGPEFDAHAVDFRVLAQRNQLYRPQEQAALKRFEDCPRNELEMVHACRLQHVHPEVGPQIDPQNHSIVELQWPSDYHLKPEPRSHGSRCRSGMLRSAPAIFAR